VIQLKSDSLYHTNHDHLFLSSSQDYFPGGATFLPAEWQTVFQLNNKKAPFRGLGVTPHIPKTPPPYDEGVLFTNN